VPKQLAPQCAKVGSALLGGWEAPEGACWQRKPLGAPNAWELRGQGAAEGHYKLAGPQEARVGLHVGGGWRGGVCVAPPQAAWWSQKQH